MWRLFILKSPKDDLHSKGRLKLDLVWLSSVKDSSFLRLLMLRLQEEYKKQLAENLLRCNNHQRQSRILAFKSKPPPPPEGFENSRKSLYSQNASPGESKPRAYFRHIPQTAERTLDAPDLLDDYYLNLLDWSANNVLAIALGNTVYLWDATTCSIAELLTADEDGPVTSVHWAPDGRYLAVGLNNADVQLWDSQELRQVRQGVSHHFEGNSLVDCVVCILYWDTRPDFYQCSLTCRRQWAIDFVPFTKS